jgi:hypothetical protein
MCRDKEKNNGSKWPFKKCNKFHWKWIGIEIRQNVSLFLRSDTTTKIGEYLKVFRLYSIDEREAISSLKRRTIDLLDDPYLTSCSLKLVDVPRTSFM